MAPVYPDWVRVGVQGNQPREMTMAEGTFDQMKGKAKETVGDVTDDEELQAEGKVDQLAGTVKDKAAEVVDVIRDAAGKVIDKVKDVANRSDAADDDARPPRGEP